VWKLEELGVILEKLASAEGEEPAMSMHLRDIACTYLAALIEHRKLCRFTEELMKKLDEFKKSELLQGDPRCDV
jgi:hypothetical protein